MMLEQDYIRAGVELADGWEINESNFGTTMIVPPFITPDEEGIQGWSLEYAHQGIKDALAAQLVRQYYKKRPMHYPLSHEADPITTIKDIIDSKVLQMAKKHEEKG